MSERLSEGARNGEADKCEMFQKFWLAHKEHHLAYTAIIAGEAVAICIRIFDIYAAAIVVSRDPNRYVRDIAGRAKLRFLVIDSVSGKTVETAFSDEVHRMAIARHLPPFSGPTGVRRGLKGSHVYGAPYAAVGPSRARISGDRTKEIRNSAIEVRS